MDLKTLLCIPGTECPSCVLQTLGNTVQINLQGKLNSRKIWSWFLLFIFVFVFIHLLFVSPLGFTYVYTYV